MDQTKDGAENTDRWRVATGGLPNLRSMNAFFLVMFNLDLQDFLEQLGSVPSTIS